MGLIITLISSGFFFIANRPDNMLHVFFLNVGQGDATLIRTPSGKNILVDSGPDRAILTELKESLPFFNNQLDYVFLTHFDKDHSEGFIHVLKKYSAKQVFITGIFKNDYLSRAFFKLVREKNIQLILADEKSDIILEDGIGIDILFPFKQDIKLVDQTDNYSLVAKIIYGKNEIIFTGDAENKIEEKLLKNGVNLDADILKVGHHGSKTSTSEDFLEAVTPQYAIISVGKNNPYRHPHESVLKKLQNYNAKILRTDIDGRIEFIFSRDGISEIKTQVPQHIPQSKRTISAPSERNFSSNRS